MSILFILSIGFFFIYLGNQLFHKLLNPLSLYTFVWTFILFSYELKLIRYKDLTTTTWLVIAFTFLAFTMGVFTFFAARYNFEKPLNPFKEKTTIHYPFFADDGKAIKLLIYIFSIIGVLAAIQHWMVLIKEFGSIPMVLIKSATVYRMRVEGEIKGVVPYVFSFTYVATFFAALYAGYYNKFRLFTVLPFFAMILKSLAEVARASMLFGLIIFFLTYVLMRYLRSQDKNDSTKLNRRKIIFGFSIIFSVLILTAALVKTFRAPSENYKASTHALRQVEKGFLISPSIYLYSSAHIGVLNAYLKKQNEQTSFGQNTFLPIYRFLAKFNLVKKQSYYQKGYYIPVWTNTGTYLREIHADFGATGLFIIPYLLGLVATFFWFKFFLTHDLRDMVYLVFTLIIIMFSFLVMVTRLSYWFISLILILLTIKVLKHLVFQLSSDATKSSQPIYE